MTSGDDVFTTRTGPASPAAPPDSPHTPARASGRETARLAARIVAPTLAGGVIIRRRTGMALAERYQVDRRAIALLGELRGEHGPGPLRLDVAGRRFAVLLHPEDAGRVLAGTPDPYTPATREKRAALEQFQPHGVLISTEEERGGRDERRAFNEAVLEYGKQTHSLAPALVRTVREEAGKLLGAATAGDGEIDWRRFHTAWNRTVRRIVLGDAARDDTALTAMLDRLRSAGNWSFAAPRRTALRDRFERRLRAHLDRAEPGSLAAALSRTPAAPGTDPAGQVPHWLFAFDAAGIAAFRTLALLSTHGRQRDQVRGELAVTDLSAPHLLPYTRACVLDTVRLWPTTPFLLRESVRETRWGADTLPAGTGFLIYAPLFHRDEALPYADRLTPEIWLDGTARHTEALLPFSAGPAGCPGEDLVLLATSTALAALLERHDYLPERPARLRPDRPLPRTLDHFSLRLAALPR
ncbi:cytochrome P450 [Streptomyces lichenis]|uniref:Cytochrome P450 n=1 Tax=Streptomyces lichenis TaxID=2306967 RepID=A0ABT0I9A8_9ACTN|nr:cytochrome P450 [Streptomyces lichenis]MCK8677909.1 cytochrome P450 [Streptomyces lichenis]